MPVLRQWRRALGALIIGAFLACSSSRPARSSNHATENRACGTIQAPKLVGKVEASYPDDLRKRGVHGTVLLTATLTADGVLQDIKVLSSPNPRLSEHAVEAFRQWRYRPAVCGGKPIQVYIKANIAFGPHPARMPT